MKTTNRKKGADSKTKRKKGVKSAKNELVWFALLLLTVAAAIIGMKVSYRAGFYDGIHHEKIRILEMQNYNHGKPFIDLL